MPTDLAPIILFVYKRPKHTKATLDALAKNHLAKDSILYIYCDGAKSGESESGIAILNETRAVADNENRFQEVHVVKNEKNKGLAKSIVAGVTDIVNKHGSAIIVEDDILTSSTFLSYMNQALEVYAKDEKVFSVSGYKPPCREFGKVDSFFLPFSFPWGWAVWKRSWENFTPDSVALKEQIDKQGLQKELNFSYYPYYEMLMNDIKGVVSSWFVRFYAHHLLNDGLCLYPGISLTKNIGFDNTGEHCNTEDDYFSLVPFGNVEKIERKPLALDPNIWHLHKQEFRNRDPNPSFFFKVKRKLKKLFN